MNIKALLEEISIKELEIRTARDFITHTKQAIADHDCPFKIGDHVISGDGKEEVVAVIDYSGWGLVNYTFKTFKIKKDGTPYKYSSYAYSQEEYKSL